MREGKLEFTTIDPKEFLLRVRRKSASPEVPGGIKSQYEHELLHGDPDVGTLALDACGKTVGALSYALLPLRNEPGTVGGRVDVVLTEPECRGHGIASLLIATLLVRFFEEHGDRLRSFSVIAAHPSIGSIAERFGFTRLETGESDLYTLRIEPGDGEAFANEVRRTLTQQMSGLRSICVQCQKSTWNAPWCRSEDEE